MKTIEILLCFVLLALVPATSFAGDTELYNKAKAAYSDNNCEEAVKLLKLYKKGDISANEKQVVDNAIYWCMGYFSKKPDLNIHKITGNDERISKIFIRLLYEQIGITEDKVSKVSSFSEDFGADSVDLSELVMAIEEQFDIELFDAEAEEMTTVNSAINLIASKIYPLN